MSTSQLDQSVYRSAEQLLRTNRPALVRGGDVTPHWIDDGAQFWYLNGATCVLVDPASGTRQPGFQPVVDANPLEIASPDGKSVVFRRGTDLWVRPSSSSERQLTMDGDYGAHPDLLMYSTAFTRLGLPHAPPAVAWSPDSTKVLTHLTSQDGVRSVSLVSSLPDEPPQLRTKRFPYAGDADVPLASFVVIGVSTGEVVRAQADPLPMPIMSPISAKLAWWAADSSAVYYLTQSADQRTSQLHQLDPTTGSVRVVVRETGDTRVAPGQQPTQPPMVHVFGDRVLWYSERDGWGHLYLYSLDGLLLGQLTSGSFMVQQILHVSSDSVYFTASGLVSADPYRRSVCRVGLDGTGFTQLVDSLDHVVTVPPNGQYFIDSASTIDTPPVITVRSWSGDVLVSLERADISALSATGWTPPSRFEVLAADGETPIYGVVYRPHDFSPSKRYPVIDHVYPLPAMPRVSPAFDPGWHGYDAESLAALGFVVIAIDGRGTPGRDKAFHDFSYGDMAGACGLADHVAALSQLAARWPWLDLSRVGICGISAGGFGTVRAMLDFPEVFKAGVAESGLHDCRFGDPWSAATYGPYSAAEAIRASTVESADRLRGKLLLVHGGLDDQVAPDQTLRLAERLIQADKDFELLFIPGADHIYTGYEKYVSRRKWDFLVRHLHP